MTAIPERLRERAKALLTTASRKFLPSNVGYWPTDEDARFITTALHEIEQAARAEGERAGIEAAIQCVQKCHRNTKLPILEDLFSLRALPTPAEPAKGA